MNVPTSLSISDLRQRATAIINTVVKTQTPTIIFQRSKPKVVLVDVNYFQALEEAVLDLSDANEAEKAKQEEKIPFTNYLKKRWGKSSA